MITLSGQRGWLIQIRTRVLDDGTLASSDLCHPHRGHRHERGLGVSRVPVNDRNRPVQAQLRLAAPDRDLGLSLAVWKAPNRQICTMRSTTGSSRHANGTGGSPPLGSDIKMSELGGDTLIERCRANANPLASVSTHLDIGYRLKHWGQRRCNLLSWLENASVEVDESHARVARLWVLVRVGDSL